MTSPASGPAAFVVGSGDSTAVSMAIRFSGQVACFRIVRLGRGDGSAGVNEPSSVLPGVQAFGRRSTLFVRVRFDAIVDFYCGAAFEASQNSVSANDNLVALFKAAQDFDVG